MTLLFQRQGETVLARAAEQVHAGLSECLFVWCGLLLLTKMAAVEERSKITKAG